jgi:hypothetical protein
MLAHGFTVDFLVDLIRTGMATTRTERVPHAEGPVVERTCSGVRRVGSEMRFADREGVVAVLLQDFGNGRGAFRDAAVIAGIAGVLQSSRARRRGGCGP